MGKNLPTYVLHYIDEETVGNDFFPTSCWEVWEKVTD